MVKIEYSTKIYDHRRYTGTTFLLNTDGSPVTTLLALDLGYLHFAISKCSYTQI
jgi:hypothetical protein